MCVICELVSILMLCFYYFYTIFGFLEATLVILLLYAYAMTPMSYITSYMFTKPATGFMYLLVFNVLSGRVIFIDNRIIHFEKLSRKFNRQELFIITKLYKLKFSSGGRSRLNRKLKKVERKLDVSSMFLSFYSEPAGQFQ